MNDSNPYEQTSTQPQGAITQYERDVRLWAMLIHLSVLAGFVIPVAGWILPVVIWQIKKDEMPELDVHGKIVVNWLISTLIYGFVCFLLIFVVIGIPLIILLSLVTTIYSIVGGIKANSGEVWNYPMSIQLI